MIFPGQEVPSRLPVLVSQGTLPWSALAAQPILCCLPGRDASQQLLLLFNWQIREGVWELNQCPLSLMTLPSYTMAPPSRREKGPGLATWRLLVVALRGRELEAPTAFPRSVQEHPSPQAHTHRRCQEPSTPKAPALRKERQAEVDWDMKPSVILQP